MSFDSLGLHAALLTAVQQAGHETPTEVQSQAIPAALQRQDLRVSAPTGSGKTAAFMLPALQRLLEERHAPAAAGQGPRPDTRRDRQTGFAPRVLVLTPTRELAMQVARAADDYGSVVPGLRIALLVGGVPYGGQLKALRGPLDIIVATPGRLIDHLGSGKLDLSQIGLLVLDEADRMLDMGFIDDIRHVAEALPRERQTVMFSATFAGPVGRLAEQLLNDGARTIEVASHTERHDNITQRLHWADDLRHKDALLDHLLTERDMEQAVVFTSTQRDADHLADRLADMGHAVASLHGGLPQGRRTRVLDGLRRGHLKVLVATDVAARGIDVPTISHVINYGLPMKAEDYVHRIGRTGRAGRSGLAITLAERRDISMIKRIQHFTTQQMPVETVVGLEPQLPEPRLIGGRPGGPGRGFGPGPRGGRPGGGRPGHGFGPGPRREGGEPARPFGDRPPRHARPDPRFDGARPAPHREGGAPRRDARPAGGRPFRGHDGD
ncbi:DEAD/DEAH box helicase [Aquabacterium sp. J223]|uniref:DEAD/DEAH box helicase n=1 Tax=Aquabacterium sp. J223 TaxID=2898431 RepID=UPI0021AD87EA|nr:DEAD/DEAH box helicase [Aquabacterium sp. J223]UUX94073.1 DEAD/DEAH box helicase [Aquabacterium sp. J223]